MENPKTSQSMIFPEKEPKNQRIIIWFRNNLRLLDNGILNWAVEKVGSLGKDFVAEVVPVFCFDPRVFTEMAYKDIRKAGILRTKFMIESVVCLRKKLQEIGSNLYVSTAKPDEFIPNLMQNGQATTLVYQRETSL